MSYYFVGVDLGQAQDFTALSIVEQKSGHSDEYFVRHLERFRLGTPYPDIVSYLRQIWNREPLCGQATLVADATGVGAPVVDLLEGARLNPVAITITGGATVSEENGHYRVPKRDLVTTLQVLMQSERLKVAEDLPDASTLVQELMAFRVKITAAGNDTYEAWREGAHDDLVLSLALATWYAERVGASLRRFRSLCSW